jgi:predicted nucleic acid-binding protein
MYYLDTCVVLAYAFDSEVKHENAVTMIKSLNGELFFSSFGATELVCCISRNLGKYHIPIPNFQNFNDEVKIDLLARYVIENLKLSFIDDDPRISASSLLKKDAYYQFNDVMHHAHQIKLRTGDAIHVSIAKELKKMGKIGYIVTTDSDINDKKDEIRDATGLEIIFN